MTSDMERDDAARKIARMRFQPASMAGLLLLLILCSLFAWRPMVNHSDFWNHAAIGQWIWTHHRVPTHCLFLWTSNDPYVAHSWLSEILIYLLLHAAGETAGSALAIGVVAVTSFAACLLMWQLCRVNLATLPAAFLLFTMAVACAGERFAARPEIFSFLLFAILLRLLLCRSDQNESKAGDAKLGLGLVLMFILWTNLHGAVLSGLIALWTLAGVELAMDPRSRRARALVLIAAACTAATIVNPYGYHYYSIYRMPATVVFNNIAEWKPLFAKPVVPASQIVLRFVLAAGAFICWLRAPGRRWSHLALLILFTLLAVMVRRNVVYLSLVCLAVAVPYFRAMSEHTPTASLKGRQSTTKRQPRETRTSTNRGQAPAPQSTFLPWAWAIVAALFYAYTVWPTLNLLKYGPTEGLATEQTLIVQKLGTDERTFNFYDCGSYLEWRLGGEPELYIDSVNAYPDSVFNDYWDILLANAHGMHLLDDQHIDCVIGNSLVDPLDPNATMYEIYVRVAQSPRWALIYYGSDGPVWIRRLPQWQSLWEGVPVFNGRSMDEFMQYLAAAERSEGK
jgi:hypothetical protein